MALSVDQQRRERQTIWNDVKQAVSDGNMETAGQKIQEYYETLEQNIMAQRAESVEHADRAALAQRGQRVLTSKEKSFYDQMIQALEQKDFRQALVNADLTIPTTIVDQVFDDIRQDRPILDMVHTYVTPANVRLIVDMSGQNKAQWGKLCDDIVKEIQLELGEVEVGKFKLSAFIFVCKSMLILGAEWLDRYVREHLRDALEAGLEEAIVMGTGVDMPTGMIRNTTAAYDPSTGYTAQTPVPLASFAVEDLGPVMTQLSKTEAGRSRNINGKVFMAVNPADYYTLVFPATHILTPSGYVKSDPFNFEIVESEFVPEGQAVLGLKNRYLLTVATGVEGQIEFSDHYKFLEDDRTYIIKLLGNGAPKDATSFLLLDISALAAFPEPAPVEGA